MSKVSTITGKIVDDSLCRKIDGEYYLIGDINKLDSGECYYLPEREKYYKYNTGYIVYDHYRKRYVHIKEKKLIKGVIEIEDNEIKMGFFSTPLSKIVFLNLNTIYSGRLQDYPVVSEEVAVKGGAIYDYNTGRYYLTSSTHDKARLNKDSIIYIDKIPYPNLPSNAYNFKDYSSEIYDNFVRVYEKEKENITDIPFVVSKVYKEIQPFSLGKEFETCSGAMPQHLLYQCGFLPLKDGSISAHEYVSTPIFDEKDYFNACRFAANLKNHCTVDQYTSYHVHIGNLDKYYNNYIKADTALMRKQLFVLSLYMLFNAVQQDIFEITPPYKKDLQYLINKGKDHCQSIPLLGLNKNNIFQQEEIDLGELKRITKRLFTFFNDGRDESVDYNWTSRRHINSGGNKWNTMSRYYSINFYNLIFDGPDTVEFRTHAGTTDPVKIAIWDIITTGLCKFAAKYYKEIIQAKDKFRLADVIEEIIEDKSIASSIIEYLKYTGDNYLNAFLHKQDIMAGEFAINRQSKPFYNFKDFDFNSLYHVK
jgi:hypothetical protein